MLQQGKLGSPVYEHACWNSKPISKQLFSSRNKIAFKVLRINYVKLTLISHRFLLLEVKNKQNEKITAVSILDFKEQTMVKSQQQLGPKKAILNII